MKYTAEVSCDFVEDVMRLRSALLVTAVCYAQVPRAWTAKDVEALELPAANPAFSAVHLDEESYYRIPERVLYRTYPIYEPGYEPQGYRQWLESREPEPAFDPRNPNRPEDWARAGEIVFNTPTAFQPVFFSAEILRDPDLFRRSGMPAGKDHIIPFATWVIRKKGAVELGSMGCNTCHTRVLPDGTVVPGAQGNSPNDRLGAQLLATTAKVLGEDKTLPRVRSFARQFISPWMWDDFNARVDGMTLQEFIQAGEEIPPGVTARANTSMLLPPQIPDLIGVQERRYLDHTGIIRQRNIGDLMRYSSLAQDLYTMDRYGGSRIVNGPPPSARYSDAQLYALATYLYSLRPPKNPNRFDAAAARGQAVFLRERCDQCHTPPLYTNNKLVPVEGFLPAKTLHDDLGAAIGVDPRYTLQTHKSTGLYKVPSLKGVWYRGPFGHNGSAAALDDWFNPERRNPNYIPTGFRGSDGRTRSIPGHPFGLGLSVLERSQLIAFLRTL